MATETVVQPKATVTAAPAPVRKKRSILLSILIGLVVIVAVLAAIIATRPEDFRVTRSATMAAPPADVFAQVNDFHKWDAWSPWAKLDPNAKNTITGPTSGEGAKLSWSGDSNVGEGSMTILESQPNERVRIKLDFVRPMEGTSDVEFTFKPAGENQTAVTWSMAGKNSFIAKAMSLVMDCEKMVGDSFDEGLASIKKVVEKTP